MMGKRVIKLFWLWVVLLAMAMGAGGPAAVLAQQGGGNLLTNGDFEWWDYGMGYWPLQDGIPEVQICPGWRAFWVDRAPQNVPVPEQWKRPEFRDVKSAEYAYRVRSGALAQKYFTFGGQHIAGLYQQVGGITPGTPLRFTAYMETWSCMAGDQGWNICPTGNKSNSPAPMHTKVGIDPTGGTNPWGGTVVWGPEVNAYDAWTLFQVDAVAQNSTVTVFTYSYADWFDSVFRIHNDVYIDDASLVVLSEQPPTATPASPPPATTAPVATPAPTATLDPALPTATPAPTATPFATATPLPDGAVVHTVQAGETLMAISRQYQVPVEQIIQLNNLTDANVLFVGQKLVISASPLAATPLPATPAPTALPATPAPTTTLPVTPAPTALPLTPAPTMTLPLTPTAAPPSPTPTAAPLPSTPTSAPMPQPTAAQTMAPFASLPPLVSPSPAPAPAPAKSVGAPVVLWLLVGGIGIFIGIMLLNPRSRRPRL